MRNLHCKKYNACLSEAAKKNLSELACENCKENESVTEEIKKEPLKYRDIKQCATPGCPNTFKKKSNAHKYCKDCAAKQEKERPHKLQVQTGKGRLVDEIEKDPSLIKGQAIIAALKEGKEVRAVVQEFGLPEKLTAEVERLKLEISKEKWEIVPHPHKKKKLKPKKETALVIPKKEIQPHVYCACGKPIFHKEQCEYGVSYIPKDNLTFEELIREYGKYLGNRLDELQKEIENRMAEYMRISARVAAFDEYIDWAIGPKGIDSESQKTLVNEYYELHDLKEGKEE
jgi:hypothetical protein